MSDRQAPSKVHMLLFGVLGASTTLGALATVSSPLFWLNLVMLAVCLVCFGLAWFKPSVLDRKR